MKRVICTSLTFSNNVQKLPIGFGRVVSCFPDKTDAYTIDVWYELEGNFADTQPERAFVVIAYSHPVPDGFEFVASVQMPTGQVAHIYAEVAK